MRIAPMIAALAFAFGSASAVVVYDDGGTHDIDFPSDAIFVTNGTTVNVLPGALIVPVVPGIGATVEGGSTLNVSGGRIEGLATTNPHEALKAVASTINISGGELIGSFTTNANSGAGVRAESCDLVISGGTLQGTTNINGSRGNALSLFVGTTTISDGVFNGGLVTLGGTAIISGGEFVSKMDTLLFLGLSGVTIDVTILGGRFVSEEFVSNFVFIGLPTFPHEVKISGGEFLSTGGGTPEWVSQNFPVTVTGTNLNWTPSSGPLTGTLASGDPLSVTLEAVNPNDITLVEPVSVEPSSWGAIKSQYR